ncbi:DNA polymerase III subunit gamma and tau [Bounagaea algeriensis]
MALALYRKYRPATFAEVVGQEHVTEPLRTALASGRINHAYLFSGPRGCGKTTSARILARSLNCAQGPTPDPCGECESCAVLAPEGGGSVDVIELDAASHGGVDDTRELRDRAFYAPAQSRYRIFVIDEAHMVTPQGFNALLKIVEEPPEHLVFIFATTEPDKVLTTIRSRTHHYPFRLLAPSTMRELAERICTEEDVAVEPAVYPLAIQAGGGSPRDTLSVLDQLLAGASERGITYDRAVALLGVTDVALIDDMVDALAAGDSATVYGTVDRIVEAGHDPRRFAADLLGRLRDLVLLNSVPDAADRGLVQAGPDETAKMRTQSEQLGAATLSRFADIVHTGMSEMRGATAPRLLLELLCARMLLPAVSDADTALLQRLERVERRMTIAPAGAEQAAAAASAPPAEAASAREAAPAREESAPVREEPTPQHPAAPAEEPDAAAAPPAADAPAAPAEAAAHPAAPAPADTAPADTAPAETAPGTGAPEPASEPAPEPAAEPAPAEPATSGGYDAAVVRRVWEDLLRAVSQRNRPTQALLLNAKVHDLTRGTLVLTMPTAPLVKQLAQQRRLDFVREALREVLGGEWEIHCVEEGSAPTASGAQRGGSAAEQSQSTAGHRNAAGARESAVSAGGSAMQQGSSPSAATGPRTTAAEQSAGPPANGSSTAQVPADAAAAERPAAAPQPQPQQTQSQAQSPQAQSQAQSQQAQSPQARSSQEPSAPAWAADAGRGETASVPVPPEPDTTPPPPEPPDEPEPEDVPPPPQAPDEEPEDAAAMLRDSSPVDGSDAAPTDPEKRAEQLFARELGAQRVDDSR